MKRAVLPVIVGVLVLVGGRGLDAAPVLQLYLEGGVFDETTNTWVLAPPGSSDGTPFRLWAIGNLNGPGGKGAIENVKLAVAYGEKDLGLKISLRPSQVGGRGVGSFHGFVDPSVPGAPVLNTEIQTSLGPVSTGPDGVVTNGSMPLLDDGTPLAAGVFGPGTVWQEFSLGDFTVADSPLGDLLGSFPTGLYPSAAQINVYEVSVIGGSGARLHFELYGTTEGDQNLIAGHSSRPDVELLVAPEPSAFFVWCLLGLTFAGSAWMYQYYSRWRELEEEELLTPAAVPSGGVATRMREPSSEWYWRTRGDFLSIESPAGEEGL